MIDALRPRPRQASESSRATRPIFGRWRGRLSVLGGFRARRRPSRYARAAAARWRAAKGCRRRGLGRRRAEQRRVLPRAVPPWPRAGRGGDRALLPALREAQRAADAGQQHAPEPASAQPPPAGSAIQRLRAPGSILELLQVYLDEAEEVLRTIAHAARMPRNARRPGPAGQDAARVPHPERQRPDGGADGPRRGGVAGRQVLNSWLEQKRATSAPPLEPIEAASSAFAGWIEKLRGRASRAWWTTAGSSSSPRRPRRRLRGGAVAHGHGRRGHRNARPVRDLHEGSRRAGQGAAGAMRQGREALPAQASQDFMRAAHTLASTSRTAGFIPLAELAGAGAVDRVRG